VQKIDFEKNICYATAIKRLQGRKERLLQKENVVRRKEVGKMRRMTKVNWMQGVAITSVLCLMGAANTCQAATKNGWVKESSGNNGWYYYVDNKKVCNTWEKSGNDWYYLGDNGEMVTSSFINGSDHYVSQAPDNNYSDWYYVQSDGRMATGWLEVKYQQSGPMDRRENQWYYFGSSGVMYSSAWILGERSWYYVLEDGTLLTDVIGATLRDNGDYRYEQDNMFDYIYDKEGKLITGWCQDRDTKDWYYCNEDGIMYENRWVYLGNQWYYLGEGGIMYTNETQKHFGKYGIAEVDGNEFCFTTSGTIKTGWVDLDDDRRSEKWHYFGTDGAHVVNRWSRINGKWYFLGNTGEMVTGFLKRSGTGDYTYEEVSEPVAAGNGEAYYYLNPNNGDMVTGAFTLYGDDKKTILGEYYFDSDGEMITEEVRYVTKGGSRTYYFYGSDGKRVADLKNTTIWRGSNGKYYAAETAANEADKAYASVDANGVIRLK